MLMLTDANIKGVGLMPTLVYGYCVILHYTMQRKHYRCMGWVKGSSLEAREQKHQKIKKYAENTTFQNKWPMIFRHEFFQEIFLGEKGFDVLRCKKRQNKYMQIFWKILA